MYLRHILTQQFSYFIGRQSQSIHWNIRLFVTQCIDRKRAREREWKWVAKWRESARTECFHKIRVFSSFLFLVFARISHSLLLIFVEWFCLLHHGPENCYDFESKKTDENFGNESKRTLAAQAKSSGFWSIIFDLYEVKCEANFYFSTYFFFRVYTSARLQCSCSPSLTHI